MRIVVDAFGSDERPAPDVEGAFLSAREWGDQIILVGDEGQVRSHLGQYDVAGLNIEVVHAEHEISMTEQPTVAARDKPQSSIHVGTGLVAGGEADAFVSAGNTGAILAISTLTTLKRIKGVKRPALIVTYPRGDGFTIGIDAGANADSRPEHMVQFAIMASIYAERVFDIKSPRVALLSNGEEEGKGNEFVKETRPLLAECEDIIFVGNVEPKEVFMTDTADVVVHDGFSGNIMMKSAEAGMLLMSKLLRQNIKEGALTSVGGLMIQPAVQRVRQVINPSEIGGAALVGVNGPVIIGHGRSDALAIKNAVRQARKLVEGKVVETIGERFG